MQIFGDDLRFGIHSAPQHTDYSGYIRLWQRAEELGFDWASDFDHFLPLGSDSDGPCFEGTTMLAATAAQTRRIRCGMLVIGVTYRHPAVLANIAATLDHIAGGRLEFGVGAAWFELEHSQYGIPFPPIGVRMDMLDETCRILRSLWTQETTTFEGKHYRLEGARCEPKPKQEHLPLVIGGAGERRTLRIVAEHGDIWNTFLMTEQEYRRKLDALAGHCADVGREPSDVRKSLAFITVLDENEADAERRADEAIANWGGNREALEDRMIVGTPEQCVERLRPFVQLGVRDFLVAARAPVDETTLELVMRSVAPALR